MCNLGLSVVPDLSVKPLVFTFESKLSTSCILFTTKFWKLSTSLAPSDTQTSHTVSGRDMTAMSITVKFQLYNNKVFKKLEETSIVRKSDNLFQLPYTIGKNI